MALSSLVELLQEYGSAANVSSRSQLVRTTLTLKSCNASFRIKIYNVSNAKSNLIASSIFRALTADTNGKTRTNTKQSFHSATEGASLQLTNSVVVFDVKSKDVASLRASLNTYIRLTEASYRCIAIQQR